MHLSTSIDPMQLWGSCALVGTQPTRPSLKFTRLRPSRIHRQDRPLTGNQIHTLVTRSIISLFSVGFQFYRDFQKPFTALYSIRFLCRVWFLGKLNFPGNVMEILQVEFATPNPKSPLHHFSSATSFSLLRNGMCN